MALKVFLALGILGVDFLIYVLFQWTWGDKRRAIARRVAEQRKAAAEQGPRPFLIAARASTPRSQRHAAAETKRNLVAQIK